MKRQLSKVAAILLAAGRGRRMKSEKPKVLFEVGGKPMIVYPLALLKKIGIETVVLVLGYKAGEVKKVVGEDYLFAYQKKQWGTARAVLVGLTKVPLKIKEVLVLNGDDSFLYKPETILGLLKTHREKRAKMTLLTLSYPGRIALLRVVRGKTGEIVGFAKKEEGEINCGLYCFDKDWLRKSLPKIKLNQKGEYPLTDLVKLGVKGEDKVATFPLKDRNEWQGVNTQEDLFLANKLMEERQKNE